MKKQKVCTCEMYDESLGHEEGCQMARGYESQSPLEALISTSPNGIITIAGIMNYLKSPGVNKQFQDELGVYIVRAVNSHKVMLKALKRIEAINGSTGGYASMVEEFKFIAREAIEKAEGKGL